MTGLIAITAFILVSSALGSAPVLAQNAVEGRKLYSAYCSSCHGEMGKGNGVAAGSLPVKPADHTSGATMNKLTDKFLQDIIAKGGGAVGKSTFMPPWGGALNENQIRDIVAYIRTLAVPPYRPQ